MMTTEPTPDVLLARLQTHLPELLQYVVTEAEVPADDEEAQP